MFRELCDDIAQKDRYLKLALREVSMRRWMSQLSIRKSPEANQSDTLMRFVGNSSELPGRFRLQKPHRRSMDDANQCRLLIDYHELAT